MKLDYTVLAVACSFAFVSLASAQVSQGQANQKPTASTTSQEIQPAPDMQQTTPPDMSKAQQMPESPNPDAARTAPPAANDAARTERQNGTATQSDQAVPPNAQAEQ